MTTHIKLVLSISVLVLVAAIASSCKSTSGIKSDAGTDTDTDTDVDTDTDTDTDVDTDTDTDTDVDTDTDTDTDTDETCADNDPCGDHGTCVDTEDGVECECDDTWAGEFCNECAAGFHLEGEDCVLDQACLPNSCDGHGDCTDTDGIVVCACYTGYTGDYCDECATSYCWDADSCVVHADCDVADPCGTHGTCDDSECLVSCACDTGWDGENCDTCAAGYHTEGDDCVLDQTCLPSSCNGHGDCTIVLGEVTCDCDTGYTGTYCDDCDTGFCWDAATCVVQPDCDVTDPCDNGVCNVTDCELSCACDSYWEGDLCDSCVAGFQDNDDNDTCELACVPLGPACDHGTCEDADGTADCACDDGWEGVLCDTCSEDSYEDNDYDTQAHLLTDDWSDTGLGLCDSDDDWFRIYLAETDVLDVTLTFTHASTGDVDLYVWYLFDSTPSFDQLRDYSASLTDNETASVTVASGEAGAYLIEVRAAGAFVQNTYDIQVTRTGPGCNTCAYLGNTCGTWDDGCSSTIDCDYLCPGLGTTHVCEEYQWGTCAEYYDDLLYGCCEGTILHSYVWGDPPVNADCSGFGMECGWDNITDQPPLTGYFKCNPIGTSDTAPPGVFETCPAGMTWAP